MADRAHVSDDLLDLAPCGFLSFADDGAVRVANATLLAMLGYAREEVVGAHVERLLTVGARVFYQTHFFPLLRLHGHAEEVFLLLRAKDGRDVGALANAVRREREGAWVTDCVLMEVRERRKFEDALLRAKKTAEEAHAEADRHRRELERANALLEAQAVELEANQRQLEENATELEAQGEELRTTNEALVAHSHELERLRREADDANRAKSQFLAMMSHELRTPLNAIGGYVQLLEMGIHGPVNDAQRGALEKVERAQRHLLRLINEVLNLARIESGRVEYEVRSVPVREMVDAVMPMIEPQLGARRLRHELSVPADLVVLADREKAQQVLLNLLSNAAKFTPALGCVSVRAFADRDGRQVVHIEVQDTGIGIAPDRLASVFEPFVQVDSSHLGRTEGTGLGLAISRDLARGMGGNLTAESTPAIGSTFRLTLRAAADA